MGAIQSKCRRDTIEVGNYWEEDCTVALLADQDDFYADTATRQGEIITDEVTTSLIDSRITSEKTCDIAEEQLAYLKERRDRTVQDLSLHIISIIVDKYAKHLRKYSNEKLRKNIKIAIKEDSVWAFQLANWSAMHIVEPMKARIHEFFGKAGFKMEVFYCSCSQKPGQSNDTTVGNRTMYNIRLSFKIEPRCYGSRCC